MSEPTPEELAAIRDAREYDAPSAPRTDLRKAVSYLPDIHRLLPQSPEAEQGVLSCILMFPLEVMGMCEEKRITAEYFHIPAHGEIYNACREIVSKGLPLDFIALAGYLRDRQRLDMVGGAAMINSLFVFLSSAANVGYYIEILCEKFVLRRIIQVGTEYAARSYDEQDEVPTILDAFERAALDVRKEIEQSRMVSVKETVMQAIADIQELYERRGKCTGIETGFPGIDDLMNGLQPEMIVIAARPSQGKTALAMNIAEWICVDCKKPVAFFSLEMSRRQLMQRLLASRARVNLKRIQQGFLDERDFPALTAAAAAIAASPFYIDDGSSLTIEELRGRARRLKREHGIVAVFVDYLQLLRSSTKRAQDNRQQEVAEVSGGLKAMVKELEIPVVVLCQIGRDFEKRGPVTSRPRLSDLKESGAIEQDADSIAFLVRPEAYAEDDEERERLRGRAEFILGKQRMGPTGDVGLTFLKEFTRFESRAEGYDDESIEAAGRQTKQATKVETADLPL